MHIPDTTYRLQFSPEFTFDSATSALPYLVSLGISNIYASPIFKAVDGSVHGYDVVDQNCINPELGGYEKFHSLCSQARALELGWLQDIVPNHMAFDCRNQFLSDVFEKGQRSQYASFFDIDWEHSYENIKGRVLAPFLGGFYGESLEKGELRLDFTPNGFVLRYFGLTFPIAIETYQTILSYRKRRLREELGEDHPDFIKFLGLLYVTRTLTSGEESEEINDQARFVKRMLWEMYTSSKQFRNFLEQNLLIFNGTPGIPESFNLLDELLSRQVFRLSYWKIATKEINYRRFFNINSLISLRLENREVFDQTHSMIFDLVKSRKITGLRIDHLDGLYDPRTYLDWIHECVPDCYVIVEKILGPDEELPEDFIAHGSTGYDFVNFVNGLFVAKHHEKSINRIYHSFIGTRIGFQTLLEERKRLISFEHMAGDINNLVQQLKSASSRDRHGSDITQYGLRRGLMEIMVAFPIYRTYISDGHYSQTDRNTVEAAVKRAIQNNPALTPELDFMRKFLLLDYPLYSQEANQMEWLNFVMRLQQFTGPLMAKALEDTSFYVYNRLISINEVGGDPGTFGQSVSDFHGFIKRRFNRWPASLNTTSTHDTKRGEDSRARINVLSEMPNEWEMALKRWNRLNKTKKTKIDGQSFPDRNDEYFLYQSLIGALPPGEFDHAGFVERMKAYVVKAVREAKIHTAWIRPDTDYEQAFVSFVENILEESPENSFLQDFMSFTKRIARAGMLNSLSQTLIKLTAPGVPDFYQGTELWDLNLVDPDNRRTVNFQKRSQMLDWIKTEFQNNPSSLLNKLMSEPENGAIKLFVIWRGLQLRRLMPELFRHGFYLPLEARGTRAKNVIAFARINNAQLTVTVVPRLCSTLFSGDSMTAGTDVWADSVIHAPKMERAIRLKNVFTGENLMSTGKIRLDQAIGSFPVGLFVNSQDPA